MKTIFRPFGIGVELTEEERQEIKKQATEAVNKMFKTSVITMLVAKEVASRLTANLLTHTAEQLKEASVVTQKYAYEVADYHDAIEAEISLIKEGEVLEVA